ncbi:MAG: Cytosine deaminase, partial [uncultured Microvirga sp.]
MGFGFAQVPEAPCYRLCNARAPLTLVATSGLAADAEGLSRVDLTVDDGRIASILPAGTFSIDADLPQIDLDGGLVLPRFVDIHTHLDKGHIWPRRPNPDGTFAGALGAVRADREAHWSAEDVRARMTFSLRCAFAHGTGAIRTHLDVPGPQGAISWPVFSAVREAWAGRIALQAVSLFPIDLTLDDEPAFREIVRLTAEHGGILGGVTFLGEPPGPRTVAAIERVVRAAQEHNLDLDLHVDESGSPDARTLDIVADAVLASGFSGRALCGHCCALSRLEEAALERMIARVTEARLAIVSLPMCNMY